MILGEVRRVLSPLIGHLFEIRLFDRVVVDPAALQPVGRRAELPEQQRVLARRRVRGIDHRVAAGVAAGRIGHVALPDLAPVLVQFLEGVNAHENAEGPVRVFRVLGCVVGGHVGGGVQAEQGGVELRFPVPAPLHDLRRHVLLAHQGRGRWRGGRWPRPRTCSPRTTGRPRCGRRLPGRPRSRSAPRGSH